MKTQNKINWPTLLWFLVLALALGLMIKSDLAHCARVAELSKEGSLPPQRELNSPTGYALGQRNFLGTYERGETYRWIAATQDLIHSGPFASPLYLADNAPEGRVQLIPKVYTVWLAAISWSIHFITSEPIAISVEQAALCEPVVSHIFAFVAFVGFIAIRYGAANAGMSGLFLVLFPPFCGQFLPGVLGPRTWALMFTAYVIALNVPRKGDGQKSLALSIRSALATSLALWLDPSLGFPTLLISAAAGVVTIITQKQKLPSLLWSCIGSVVTLAAWLLDRSPWDPAVGELRYLHPLYAFAWFGIGLALDGWQNWRFATRPRKLCIAELVAAIPLLSMLAYVQIKDGYKGWLYTGASMRRLTSLDETKVFSTAIDWFANASAAEIAFVSAPPLAAIAILGWSFGQRRDARNGTGFPAPAIVVILTCLVVLVFFKVRWGVLAALLAVPLGLSLASHLSVSVQRLIRAVFVVFLFGLFLWGRALPATLQIPSPGVGAGASDLESLIYRHFAHWLATHSPNQKVSVLAPPELSDSLVFHGGCRVLMSTAWESYPGQVAASRVLSAPESSEAEAVLQSREITHLVLPSWDEVLPLLVRQVDGKETLHARLKRWVYPHYLRPIPYRLPPTPGYSDQKLVVFKVIPPEDEVISLSRLAEYFVEMDRAEPAGLVARVLAESFPDEPNAAIARAVVYAHANNQAAFETESARLMAAMTTGEVPLAWDRRVQRAIVLAIGRRHDLARAEIAACLANFSANDAFDLTPLQAYRLSTLAKGYGLKSSDPALTELVASLGTEYNARP